MSNVLKRFREETEYQLLTDARYLRGQIFRWAYHEANIPKKKRFLFMDDIKEIAVSLVKNIRLAEYTFPTNQETLDLRISYINEALQDITELWQALQFVDDVLRHTHGFNLDNLEPVLMAIERLEIKLKAFKKNPKPKNKVTIRYKQ